MTISLLIGIPVGISAVRVNTWFDNFGKIFAILGLSLPSLVQALLILTLSVYLNWLLSSAPTAGEVSSCPPSLMWVHAAHMRLARSAMLEVWAANTSSSPGSRGFPSAAGDQ